MDYIMGVNAPEYANKSIPHRDSVQTSDTAQQHQHLNMGGCYAEYPGTSRRHTEKRKRPPDNADTSAAATL